MSFPFKNLSVKLKCYQIVLLIIIIFYPKVATSKPVEYTCPNNSSRSKSPQTFTQDGHRLPECLQIHPLTLASMVMPVNQIIRAHASQNKSEMKKSDELANPLNVYLNGRNAVTDASYSSEFSDGESWGRPPVYDHTNTGYLSDNHLIEAVSEAKMLNMSKQQLDMRLSIRPGSKIISSSRTQTNSSQFLYLFLILTHWWVVGESVYEYMTCSSSLSTYSDNTFKKSSLTTFLLMLGFKAYHL